MNKVTSSMTIALLSLIYLENPNNSFAHYSTKTKWTRYDLDMITLQKSISRANLSASMIQTLEQLVTFTKEQADKIPTLQSEILLPTPGLSLKELDHLQKELPFLPASYVEVLKKVRLDRFSLEFFQFSPMLCKGQTWIDSLIKWNQTVDNPLFALHKKNKTYEIARLEANPIGIVYQDGIFSVGQIVEYDIESSSSIQASILANSFTQFLLLVGNLAYLHQNMQETEKTCTQIQLKFENVLQILFPQRDQNTIQAWKNIIESIC